jgi:uncharacterized protein with NAD-binding domain and iron-sulfur cluster
MRRGKLFSHWFGLLINTNYLTQSPKALVLYRAQYTLHLHLSFPWNSVAGADERRGRAFARLAASVRFKNSRKIVNVLSNGDFPGLASTKPLEHQNWRNTLKKKDKIETFRILPSIKFLSFACIQL